jgi:gluconolactonase
MTSAEGEDALDGMKIDQKGNLYVSGPGGLWVISPEGKHLGTIVGPEHLHNMAWVTTIAKHYIFVRKAASTALNTPGIRP